MPRLRGGVIKRGRTWSYVIRVTDPATGVNRPRWVGGFRTEDEAKTARDEARRRARRGEYVDRTAVTVAEYLRQWLVTHSLETKPKTLAGYRWLVEHYVVPRIGGLRMQSVQPSDLSTLYRSLLDGGGRGGKPLSRGTVDAVHAVLRKAFNDAVTSEQVLESSPVVRAKRPRVTEGEREEVWSPADLARFLSLAQSHRLYAFFYVAAFTGARRGELLNLSWSDVDLAAGVLRITGSTAVVERQRVVGSTKGGRRRTVSIDESTVRVLRAHRARQVEEQLVVETDWPDSDLVFRTAFGEPLYPDTPSQLMPKLVRRHNVEHPDEPLLPMRLHDLRHVHATTLLLAGVPVHVVAARLGHGDPNITLRVYAHVLQDLSPAVADAFARAVTGVLEEVAGAGVSSGVSTEGRPSARRAHRNVAD